MKLVLRRILQPPQRVLAVFAVSLLGFVLGVCPIQSHGSSAPAVSILPRSTVVDPAEAFELYIWIDSDACAISNYDLIIDFDPAILRLTEATEGVLYVNSGFSTWFAAQERSAGSWEVFDAIMQAGGALEPPGELVRLRFEALSEGFTEIQLSSVVVTDVDRYPIEAIEIESATAVVKSPTDDDVDLPDLAVWRLEYPHPNPSRAIATIGLSQLTAEPGDPPKLAVFDASGRFVRSVRPVNFRGPYRVRLGWVGSRG